MGQGTESRWKDVFGTDETQRPAPETLLLAEPALLELPAAATVVPTPLPTTLAAPAPPTVAGGTLEYNSPPAAVPVAPIGTAADEVEEPKTLPPEEDEELIKPGRTALGATVPLRTPG